MNITRLPLALIQQAWAETAEAIVSFRRIKEFLLLEEIEDLPKLQNTAPDATTNDANMKLKQNSEDYEFRTHNKVSSSSQFNSSFNEVKYLAKEGVYESVETKNSESNPQGFLFVLFIVLILDVNATMSC
jgi:hypothetical protein